MASPTSTVEGLGFWPVNIEEETEQYWSVLVPAVERGALAYKVRAQSR